MIVVNYGGSPSTLLSVFLLLRITLYMYIKFDNMSCRFNSDCLQNSKVCFVGRYAKSARRLISTCADEDRDRVNLGF